jgi:hypothetical protein|tara:strand:+ start:1064 stop:1243 length:180 start_codon:yes stop_codon:yes gene_type:complete
MTTLKNHYVNPYFDSTEVTRCEVIDETGRAYVKYLDEDQVLELSYQDDGKTLKVFISRK